MYGKKREAALYLEEIVAEALEGWSCMTPERSGEAAYHVFEQLEDHHMMRLGRLLTGDHLGSTYLVSWMTPEAFDDLIEAVEAGGPRAHNYWWTGLMVEALEMMKHRAATERRAFGRPAPRNRLEELRRMAE